MTISAPPPANHVHTFSLVTRDRPGVLVRIAMVFARRGYNIESLAVSPGVVEGFARFTITSRGKPEGIEQIHRHLSKLIDVVFVSDHRESAPIEVEIALVKLRCTGSSRAEVQRLLDLGGARVVDDSDGLLVACATGASAEITRLLGSLEPHPIEELVRSGRIVMDRGSSPFSEVLRADR